MMTEDRSLDRSGHCKITIKGQGDDGSPATEEIDAYLVDGTDGLFAVHKGEVYLDGDLLPGWVLTHVPTGLKIVGVHVREGAEYVGRQLYAAAPHGWSGPDSEALKATLPPRVEEWATLIRWAATTGVPLPLLKGCQEFARGTVRAVERLR
jgi:hypothetical protein